MLPQLGQRLEKLPRRLQFVRDLEAFEGPILSEYRAAYGGAVYVEKWCARADGVSRFLVVRSEERAIAEFLGGRLSMLKLLTERSDGFGFLIDQRQGETVGVSIVPIDILPKPYLPKPTRFHDETLRPEWGVVPQSYLIDVDDWDAKMFAGIERNFLNATSFAYHTKPGTNRELPSHILDIWYDGGYSVMHMFNAIRERVPLEARAKAAAVAAASPGVLTIGTPAETSSQLVQAIRALPESVVAYQAVHAWSRLSPDNADQVPPVARENVERLCRALNVEHRKLYASSIPPEHEKDAVLVAGKLIAAYYRVLLRVIRPLPGVEFMGVTLEHEPEISAVEIQEEEPEVVEIRSRKRVG